MPSNYNISRVLKFYIFFILTKDKNYKIIKVNEHL